MSSRTGRDARGRFLKGEWKGGPGRPPLLAESPFREGIKAAVTADRVADVIERLYELALNGDMRAADLFLAYAVGKPAQTLEHVGAPDRPITWKQVIEAARGDDTLQSDDAKSDDADA